jgi:signal recognition particle subunit SRP19
LDSARTRREGRKVPMNIAVKNPSLGEVAKAAEALGLEVSVNPDVAHPRAPVLKQGYLLVSKPDSKLGLLKKLAMKVGQMRKKA